MKKPRTRVIDYTRNGLMYDCENCGRFIGLIENQKSKKEDVKIINNFKCCDKVKLKIKYYKGSRVITLKK